MGNINKNNKSQPAWKRYFRGWNLLINGAISFVPAIMVTVILLEVGFPSTLSLALPIISFVYVIGMLREKISKKDEVEIFNSDSEKS